MNGTKGRASRRFPGVALALLVVVAALVTVIFFVLRSSPSSDAPDPTASPAARRETAAPAPSAALPAADRSDDRAANPRLAGLGSLPASFVLEPPPADGFDLQIVDAATQAPIAGALVSVEAEEGEDSPAHDELKRRLVTERDFRGLLIGSGRHYLADEQGVARIPKSREWRSLLAWADGKLGFRWCSEFSEAPLRVEVRPPRPLRVEVVDPRGVGQAGVTIHSWSDGRSTWFDYLDFTTGADGVAELPAADLLLDPDDPRAPLHLNVDGPFDHDLEREVAADELGGPPIRFEVAESGAIEVRLVDQRGRPITTAASVELTLFRSKPDSVMNDGERERITLGACAVEVKQGVGRCPFVPIGGWAEITEGSGQIQLVGRAAGPGPRRAGETIPFSLESLEGLGQYTGRVVDEHDAPLVDQKLRGWWSGSNDDATYRCCGDFVLSTDGDGGFAWSSEPLEPRFEIRGWWTVVLDDAAAGITSRGRIELPLIRLREPGPLGTIRLEPTPLLVAGRVVDESDMPIAGAHVVMMLGGDAYDPSGDGWKLSRELEEVRGLADGDGRFELHAPLPLSMATIELELRASRDGSNFAAVATARSGARDVKLVLHRTGGLAGRCLTDVGIDANDLSVEVERQMDGANEGGGENVDLNRSGNLRVNGLEPGGYLVRISVDDVRTGGRSLLAEVPDIEVRADAITRDPRLQEIDLRGKIRHVKTRVIDESGRALRDVTVQFFAPDSPDNYISENSYSEGVVDLLTAREPPLVDLRAAGFRPLRTQLVAGESTVVLKRGTEVRARLADGAGRLPEQCVLRWCLSPPRGGTDEVDGGWDSSDLSALVPGAVASKFVDWNGPAIARLFVIRHCTDADASTIDEMTSARTLIDLPDATTSIEAVFPVSFAQVIDYIGFLDVAEQRAATESGASESEESDE